MRTEHIGDLRKYKTVKKGKRILASLLDYFTIVIFTFIFYTIGGMQIANAIPYTQEKSDLAYAERDLLGKLVNETALQEYDTEKKMLISTSVSFERYAVDLIKTSFFLNGMNYYEFDEENHRVEVSLEERDTFLENGNPSLNRMTYYFTDYKKEKNIGNYELNGKDYQNALLYVNEGLLKLNSDNNDLVSSSFDPENNAFYLSEENATLLHAYVIQKDSNERPTQMYLRIRQLYLQTVSFGIDDVTRNDPEYILHDRMMREATDAFGTAYVIALICSFAIAFLVVNLFFPLCFKRNRTISFRFMALEITSYTMEWPKFYQHLLRGLVSFLLSFSSCFFTPLLYGKLNLLSIGFIGPISLIQICLFSFLLAVLSMVFLFISKNDQDLIDFASLTIVIDKKTLEDNFPIEQGIFETSADERGLNRERK